MLTNTFESFRTKKTVTVIMTDKKVTYIDEDNYIVTISRDSCWHFNEDGMHRCQEYYDDPRFEYWTNMEYEFVQN